MCFIIGKTFPDNKPLQACNDNLLTISGSLEKDLFPITLLAPLIFKSKTVRLNAQVYLKEFYEDIGYRCVSAPYSEDGIMHVEMLRVD